MKKSFTKGIVVTFFAVLAFAVVVIGQQLNSRNQYKQRVEFAESAASVEREKLESLEKTANGFYADENQVFLADDVSIEKIEAIRSQLTGIKITAEDYAIREESLPESIQGLTERKRELQEKLIDTQDKAIVQDKTNHLFTETIESWQEVTSDLSIEADASQTMTSSIREDLTLFSDSQWKENISEYLTEAEEQIQESEELQERLEHYLTEGVVVSYTDYLDALYAVEEVPNEELRTRLTELIDELASSMGLE
ncbi:hypothetical protein [Enterococcus olivae]